MDEFEPSFTAARPLRVWRWVVTLVLCCVVAAGGLVWHFVYRAASADATEVEVTVAPGQSSTVIAQTLQTAGVIRSVQAFDLYASWTGQGSRLQVGTYRLPRNLNVPHVLARLTAAAPRKELTLTIVEGWSNRELAAYLEAEGVATPAEFFAVAQRKSAWWNDYDFLASRPPDRDLEGYLFPDTYRIFSDASVTALVQKMLDNFGRKLTPELREEIRQSGKTLHEVLTLASVVEREVPDGPDRPKVAGIFAQRLEIGMPLQSDATVNYVTGKKQARPSADDLQTESLYNTYMHRGLPPGPINNPGISAIRAALHPEDSPYLYYLTTLDGTVIYSKTFDEHVRAKARYYP